MKPHFSWAREEGGGPLGLDEPLGLGKPLGFGELLGLSKLPMVTRVIGTW